MHAACPTAKCLSHPVEAWLGRRCHFLRLAWIESAAATNMAKIRMSRNASEPWNGGWGIAQRGSDLGEGGRMTFCANATPPHRIVAGERQPSDCGIRRKCRTAKGHDAKRKAADREQPKRDAAERQNPDHHASDAHVPDGDAATREHHAHRDVADGKPCARHPTPIATCTVPTGRDMHQWQAKKASLRAIFHWRLARVGRCAGRYGHDRRRNRGHCAREN